MVELELDNDWVRDEGHESSYSNNMVTKEVVAYKNNSHVLILTRTKVTPGWSVELYKTPDKRLVESEFDVEKDDLEEVAEDMMEKTED